MDVFLQEDSERNENTNKFLYEVNFHSFNFILEPTYLVAFFNQLVKYNKYDVIV